MGVNKYAINESVRANKYLIGRQDFNILRITEVKTTIDDNVYLNVMCLFHVHRLYKL